MKKKLFISLSIILSSLLFSACNPFDSKIKSGLQVITDNIQVSLFLNGEYLDKTPYINKSIQPGTYTLRIQPDDEKLTPYEAQIDLTKGLLTVVTWNPGLSPESSGGVIYEMEPIENKKSAEVSFISIPDNAIISFDGNEKEFSPLTIKDIDPGHHEFEISLPSYDTQKHKINVIAGHRLNISIKLTKNGNNNQRYIPTPAPTKTADLENDIESTTSVEINSPADLQKLINGDSTSSAKQTEEITGPRVKIKSTNFFQDGNEVLRVRDSAGSSGIELGFAKVDKSYKYLDATNNGWHKIEFDSNEGWVSGKYSELIGLE